MDIQENYGDIADIHNHHNHITKDEPKRYIWKWPILWIHWPHTILAPSCFADVEPTMLTLIPKVRSTVAIQFIIDPHYCIATQYMASSPYMTRSKNQKTSTKTFLRA